MEDFQTEIVISTMRLARVELGFQDFRNITRLQACAMLQREVSCTKRPQEDLLHKKHPQDMQHKLRMEDCQTEIVIPTMRLARVELGFQDFRNFTWLQACAMLQREVSCTKGHRKTCCTRNIRIVCKSRLSQGAAGGQYCLSEKFHPQLKAYLQGLFAFDSIRAGAKSHVLLGRVILPE